MFNPDPNPTVHWLNDERKPEPGSTGPRPYFGSVIVACGSSVDYPNEYTPYGPHATCGICYAIQRQGSPDTSAVR